MSELDAGWAHRDAGHRHAAEVPGDRGLLRAVARLASLTSTSCDADDVLRELSVVAGSVVPVDGVGVMRVVPDRTVTGQVRVAHAEPAVDDLERLQEYVQRGPCRDAVDRGDVVVVDDVHQLGARYGSFAERMLGHGLRSVAAVPLVGRGRTWAVLDLYRREPHAWRGADVDTARLLVDVAASYLVMVDERDQARAARREAEHRSLHDGLTGLPARALLLDRIGLALTAARRHGTAVGLAFVDLDRFKVVNDSLGHAAGDEVLVEVAHRLRSTVRAPDTVARRSGDEFVVLWPDVPEERGRRREAVMSSVDRLRDALRTPVRAAGEALLVTASIGVALAGPRGRTSAEALLHAADVAMYAAKEQRDAVAVRDLG